MNTNTQPFTHDPTYRMENNTGNTFTKGVIIGGLIGAAAALLFAPKSGRELRSDLSFKAQMAGEKTKDIACNIGSKAATAVKVAGDRAETVITGVKNASEAIAAQVKDVKEETALCITDAVAEAEAAKNRTQALNQPSTPTPYAAPEIPALNSK